MDPIILLAVGAIAAPAIEMLRSLFNTIRKERCEDRFEEIFLKNNMFQQRLTVLMNDPSILEQDPNALREIKALMRETLDQMDEKTRRPIEEGLEQPSERARMSYVTKLLEETKTKTQSAPSTGSQP